MTIANLQRRGSLCFSVAAVALSLSLTAHAQDAPEQPGSSGAIEEVVVTAERRAVSEQDIPISTIGLTGETLENRGVKTFEQLQYQVPSLTYVDNGNSKFLNIRGVGVSESAPNQTSGVAVHLDGAYVARGFVFGDAFFDVENVVVLRGPQGTYSGQNATGGAIFITSKKPVPGETSGFVDAEYGSYDLRRLGAGLSFPLTENFAARISGDWESRDSFYENHGPDPTVSPDRIENQPGNLNRSLGRFQLLYSPSDRVEARLIHETSDNSTDGIPWKVFPEPGSNRLPDTGLRELNYDLDGRRQVEYERTTTTLDWAATDAFRVLVNISLFGSRQHYLADADYGSPVADPTAAQEGSDYHLEDDYWTGEINLVSTGAGPVEWAVGANIIDYEQDNYLNFIDYNTPGYPGTSPDLKNHTSLFLYLNTIRKNRAVFGEIGYNFTPALQLKVGLRYNEDEVGFSDDSYLSAGPGSHYFAESGFPFPQRELFDFDAWTGRVVLNWDISDDNLVYATVSRGYKPGGTSPSGPEYDSEFVLNREVGWKANLWGEALRTSVSVYDMDYDNFQRTYAPEDSPLEVITRNVDGSTIRGIEMQLSGFIGDFLWDASFAYNDGEYGNLEFVLPPGAEDGVNPVTPTVIDLAGEPIDFLPETSLNFGLRYDGLRLGEGRLVPSVRVSYQDEYYTEFYHFEHNLTPEKTIVDLFLAYEAEGNWRLEAYALNVADNDYIARSTGEDDPPGMFILGAPRQIGLKLEYELGEI